MRVRKMRIGGWKFKIQPDNILHMGNDNIAQLQNILRQWETVFIPENTWVAEIVGKPSLIVRFDIAMASDRPLQNSIYEIEERPTGLGATMQINPFFADSFLSLLGKWTRVYGKIAVAVSPRRHTCDDSLWADLVLKKPAETIKPNGFLFLVRADPSEGYHCLATSSISAVQTTGDKSYGERLGWWRKIADFNGLPWADGFVVKPRQGSELADVYIWDPARRQGGATRARIQRAVENDESGFIQPWIEPEKHQFLPSAGYLLIRRIFFGWDPAGQWRYLGGAWNARPNLRIHGASDAIFGPVV